MLKILLILLAIVDAGVFILLVSGIILSIKWGGGNILFPGLGLVVALPLVLFVLFVTEVALVAITYLLFRYIRKQSLR